MHEGKKLDSVPYGSFIFLSAQHNKRVNAFFEQDTHTALTNLPPYLIDEVVLSGILAMYNKSYFSAEILFLEDNNYAYLKRRVLRFHKHLRTPSQILC